MTKPKSKAYNQSRYEPVGDRRSERDRLLDRYFTTRLGSPEAVELVAAIRECAE